MKRLRLCLAVYAAVFLWRKDIPRKVGDLALVHAERAYVGPASRRIIEHWPAALAEIYCLPRCVKPGFHSAYPVFGRPHRYTVLSRPEAPCGWRPNGEAADRGEPYGVVLGDSFTEGAAVSDAQTWVSRLSELSGRRFLNLGVGGQGLSGHLARLRASGVMAMRPKVVLVQVCSNDLFEDEWVQRAVDARAGTVRWDLPPKRSSPRWMGRFFGYLWNMTVIRWRGSPPPTEAQWRLFERNLSLLREEALKADARLLVLADQPYFARLVNRRLPETGAVEIPLESSHRFYYDWHWNRSGHLEVARRMRDELALRGWLNLRK